MGSGFVSDWSVTVGLNNSSHIFIVLFKLPVFVVLIVIIYD